MNFDYRSFGENNKIENIQPGLYIVSTPIGNIEDITIRAIKILRSVDVIICEHHEVTKRLLNYYQIDAKLFHYNDDMPSRHLDKICDIISSDKSVALVSDAGTPLISDPGYKIIKYVVCRDTNLFSVPGPSSLLSALTLSGLGCGNFYFHGFLPRMEAKCRIILNKLINVSSLLIFFESPHRLINTLKLFILIFGENAKISISKEITKFYEENIRGTINEVLEKLLLRDRVKGEYIIILDNTDNPNAEIDYDDRVQEMIERFCEEELSTKDVIEKIYEELPAVRKIKEFSKKELYGRVLKVKGE
jgi:16S rRNA (cytidine1402-2'-O)-methyltransferase